jgi:uncharacterized protein YukE
MTLTQGPASWLGAGAEPFTRKTERLLSELDESAQILESAANALHRFASKMEYVNELRLQADHVEQQSWQITDYAGVKQLEEQHLQFVAQVREIIKRQDVPG